MCVRDYVTGYVCEKCSMKENICVCERMYVCERRYMCVREECMYVKEEYMCV